MGILERLRGIVGKKEDSDSSKTEKSDGEVVVYILKKKVGRGWRKFKEYSKLVTPEEIIEELPPGVYRLVKVKDGKEELVWGDVVAYDDEEELAELEELAMDGYKGKRGRRVYEEDPIESFKKLADTLKKQMQVFQELGEIGLQLARFSGKNVIVLDGNKSFEDLVIEGLMQMRKKYEKLDEVFGTSKLRGSEAELPIDGKIPAWAVYAPKMLNQLLDGIEKRLYKWGLLGEEESVSTVSSKPKVRDFPDINKYKKMYSKQDEGNIEVVEVKKGSGDDKIDKIDLGEIEFIGEGNE